MQRAGADDYNREADGRPPRRKKAAGSAKELGSVRYGYLTSAGLTMEWS